MVKHIQCLDPEEKTVEKHCSWIKLDIGKILVNNCDQRKKHLLS